MSKVGDPIRFAMNTLTEIGTLVGEIEEGEITPEEGLTFIRDLARDAERVLREEVGEVSKK